MGVNLYGGDSNAYVLGRGIVYFEGENTQGTVWANAYRDLGNATEFTIAIETETKEHQSSLEGLKTTDLEVILSQKMTINFSLDELNMSNQALFFLGTMTGGDLQLGGAGGLFNASAVASNATQISPNHCNLTDPGLWLWYDLFLVAGGARIRAYDFAATQITGTPAAPDVGNQVLVDPGGSFETVLTENTGAVTGDYDLDRTTGRIRFRPGGPADLKTAGTGSTGYLTQDIEISWDAHPDTEGVRDATDITGGTDEYLSRIDALSNSGTTGKLKFVQENPVNNNFTEYFFPQVTLKPDGDFSGISDEFTTLTLTGAVEKFTGTQDADFVSQFMTVTTRKTFGSD